MFDFDNMPEDDGSTPKVLPVHERVDRKGKSITKGTTVCFQLKDNDTVVQGIVTSFGEKEVYIKTDGGTSWSCEPSKLIVGRYYK